MRTALACLAAASMLALIPADAAPRPKWEVGVGGFATYSPAYWGSSESDLGGFPVAYFIYRGDGFSIFSNGLFDVDATNTNSFDFGISVDGSGGVDSEDRLGLGDIEPVLEAGPRVTAALFANGTSRLEVSLAARVAYQWGEDFEGWVLEPSIAYLTALSPSTRLGISATPRFGYDDYNDLWYSTPGYDAEDGYMGTAFALNMASDLSDRLRLSGRVQAVWTGGSENEDSPLHQEDWNVSARIGFTYAIWQSSERED